MFAVEMLPAQEGDCLWIEYGSKASPRRILIDGGTLATAAALRKRIESIVPPEDRKFELLVVTHVDSDHIAGILKLLSNPPEGCFVKQAWFNAFPQLAPGMLGPKEGEFLAVHFLNEEAKRSGYWNGSFTGRAVGIPTDEELPSYDLDGGFKLTVLAPDARALEKLRAGWQDVIKEFEAGDPAGARKTMNSDKRYRPGYLGGDRRWVTGQRVIHGRRVVRQRKQHRTARRI